MEHEFIYGRKMPVEMLIRQVADSCIIACLL